MTSCKPQDTARRTKNNIPKAVNDLWTTWSHGRTEETPSTCNGTPPQILKTTLPGGDSGVSLTTDGSSVADTGAGEVGRPPHCPNLVVEGNATEVCGGERVRPWPWRAEVIEPSDEERLAWDMSTTEERADRDRLQNYLGSLPDWDMPKLMGESRTNWRDGMIQDAPTWSAGCLPPPNGVGVDVAVGGSLGTVSLEEDDESTDSDTHWSLKDIRTILESHDWLVAMDLARRWDDLICYKRLIRLDKIITEFTKNGVLEGRTIHCDNCEVMRWINNDGWFSAGPYLCPRCEPKPSTGKYNFTLRTVEVEDECIECIMLLLDSDSSGTLSSEEWDSASEEDLGSVSDMDSLADTDLIESALANHVIPSDRAVLEEIEFMDHCLEEERGTKHYVPTANVHVVNASKVGRVSTHTCTPRDSNPGWRKVPSL